MEEVRIKLSALWICRMLVGLQGDVLRFLQPGMMEQLMTGEAEGMQVTHELLLVAGIVMVIPIFMVFLSLTLPYKANRWANIIASIITIAFVIGGGSLVGNTVKIIGKSDQTRLTVGRKFSDQVIFEFEITEIGRVGILLIKKCQGFILDIKHRVA